MTAAVDNDGIVTALDWDQLEDCGAYLRAPEPATLYRMHGNMTGAYRVPNLAIRNRVVLTNKTPSGLVRGFGGPQVYFALERLMQRIAATLGLDPLEVIRRNLVETFSLSLSCRRGARFGRLSRRGRCTRPHEAGSPNCDGGATWREPRAGSTASVLPRWSSRRSPTWATSRPC